VQWVDRGFGHFLQMVEVEPRVFDGKFTGWTIVGLYPRDFWQDVDLREGDVVTRVNGLPIERETEAFSAFQGLKQAKELTVALERDGQVVERAIDLRAGADGDERCSENTVREAEHGRNCMRLHTDG